jgi:DNA-binding response OmpR family regulator
MTSANILVVEDEAIVALDVKARLIELGHVVAGICNSAEEAVRMAARLKVDLVLMDILLGGKKDGIDAAWRIRIRDNIPVIFLTACSDETTVKQARLVEPEGILFKPFEEGALRSSIEAALHRTRGDTGGRAPAGIHEPAVVNRPF